MTAAHQPARLIRDEEDFGPAAQSMIDAQLIPRGIADPRVLAAMRSVPRHAFVSPFLRGRAYSDAALPTLNDQTISQPYIVAVMSELLTVEPTHRVLEIGTGSGYQTMILSMLADRGSVVSVERDADLAEQARAMLDGLGVNNASVRVGDGTLGYAAGAPYDRILVTAGAPPATPPALVEQLAEGGRLVIPLGDRELQRLTVVEKRGGRIVEMPGIGCRFVPLVGEHGW